MTIGKFVAFLKAGALSGSLDFLLKVEGDVAQFLLDVTNDFSLGSGTERVSTFSKNLHEVVSEITASKIETENGVRQSITYTRQTMYLSKKKGGACVGEGGYPRR